MMAYRPSRMLSVVLLSVVLFVAWAAWFDIDQSVRAQGQVIPGARTQVIQVLDGGVLAKIRVQEGDSVKAGQVLALLEPDRAKAAFDEALAKHIALRAALLRAQAEALGQPPVFGKEFAAHPDLVAAQNKLYAQRKQSLDDALAMQKESMALAQEELKMNENLYAGGDISRIELLRARRQVSDIQARTLEIRNKYLQDARTEAARQEEEIS
ncbi:MAG: biotin/lipoyl-binding protein, partial [Rhodoferax sp.]